LELCWRNPKFIPGGFVYEGPVQEAVLGQPHNGSIGGNGIYEAMSHDHTFTAYFDGRALEFGPVVERVGAEWSDVRQIGHDRKPAP